MKLSIGISALLALSLLDLTWAASTHTTCQTAKVSGHGTTTHFLKASTKYKTVTKRVVEDPVEAMHRLLLNPHKPPACQIRSKGDHQDHHERLSAHVHFDRPRTQDPLRDPSDCHQNADCHTDDVCG